MRMDPRCKKMNLLSDIYHQLFQRLAERYLSAQCTQTGMDEPMNIGEFVFLLTVSDQEGKAVSMSEASKILKINPSTATRRVNRLLAYGMITKSDSPYDERRYDIRMTQKGTDFVQAMEDRLLFAMQQTYADVTEEELTTVYRFMDKCIARLRLLNE